MIGKIDGRGVPHHVAGDLVTARSQFLNIVVCQKAAPTCELRADPERSSCAVLLEKWGEFGQILLVAIVADDADTRRTYPASPLEWLVRQGEFHGTVERP